MYNVLVHRIRNYIEGVKTISTLYFKVRQCHYCNMNNKAGDTGNMIMMDNNDIDNNMNNNQTTTHCITISTFKFNT